MILLCSGAGICFSIHSFSILVPIHEVRLLDRYGKVLCLRPG